ncbi:MAG: arginine--tRNA ligase [Candidatus Thermoplasmatota archaeon]|nr:arginine--tRNA ligase [Candidatus Thermoplasmatota archaeon]
MLLFDDVRESIIRVCRKIVPDVGSKDLDTDRTGHADFSLKLFRLSGKPDFDQLKENIVITLRNEIYVDSVTVEGNYLNIKVKDLSYLDIMDTSIKEKGVFPDTFQDPERVLLEHTSTNPTGPIHIGRSRNSIVGDSLSRVLKRYGYRVSTQYFVNDTGKQVMGLYLGYRKSKERIVDIPHLLEGYRNVYREIEEDKGKEKEIEALIKKYESGDPAVVREVREICTVMLKGIISSLARIGIKIDDYVWESGFLKSEEMNDVLSALSERIKTENDAQFIELSNGSKVFLRRADGTSLYTLRDLAYHKFKSLNYDWLIDVLGEDHRDYAKSLNEILQEMVNLRSKISFVFYSFISLDSGKMSTRSGNVVTLDELIEKAEQNALEIVKSKRPDLPDDDLHKIASAVAVSAIRFQIAKISLGKELVFKWSEALNLEGDSAPYIMYSYARTTKILKEARVDGNMSTVFDKYESSLIRKLYLYPYSLQAAKDGLRVDPIASYVLELVRSFNDFYNNCRVVGSGEHEVKRAKIVSIYRHVLKDASYLLGITLLDEM